MDVHRCRFVPFQPSAVNALAFSQSRPRASKHQSTARLAIGRANGDIEIWNPSNGSWFQELVMTGGKDRSVDGLVWINEQDQDLGDGHFLVGRSRLFSIGYTSTITEWDLETAKPKRHASGQHGDIWCMAAQPPPPVTASSKEKRSAGISQEQQATSTKLVAGTINGELVMYTVEDDDLRFQRVLVRSPTRKAQMVSITFQSRRVVLVGCSDSTIRAIDVQTGRLIRSMTLGADLAGGAKDIIVWSVKCLPNGNIVSGDSTGQICIWDGKTYTQSQRIQSHKQDVLSLAVSEDGLTIVSGGMDRRTIIYKQNQGAGGRWSKVSGRRYHQHDVKAMASFEQNRMSVVVSGGPDSSLIVLPLKEVAKENHRTISSLPQEPSIISAPRSRFLVSWWDREIHIWTLKQPVSSLLEDSEDSGNIDQNRKLLKTIVVKGDANISSATINKDGTLLFVATTTDIKAFRLQHENPETPADLTLSSMTLPTRLAENGATRIKLSPDEKWLCIVREGSRVVMANLGLHGEEKGSSGISLHNIPRLRRNTPPHVLNGGLGRYDRNITHISFSPDSKVLAIADLAGYLDTWVIRDDAINGLKNGLTDAGGDDDDDASSSSESVSSLDEEEGTPAEGRARWVRNPAGKLLPKLPASPVVLSFSDLVPGSQGDEGTVSDDYVLLAVTSSWQILAFHPLQGSLTPWSRRHGKPSLPLPIRGLLDVAKGAIWEGSRVWIYGVSFLFMLDMSQDLRSPSGAASGGELALANLSKKRKRNGPKTGAGGKMLQGNLAPHSIQRHAAGGEVEEMDLDDEPQDGEDNDDDDSNSEGGMDAEANGDVADATEGTVVVSQSSGEKKKWWITYKYRPIFGLVPMSEAGEPLEVALVERPTWDMDMPERYVGKDEWGA